MSLRLGRFNHNHYYSMKKKSAFYSLRHNFQQGASSNSGFYLVFCFLLQA